MTCRDEILACVKQIVARKGQNSFTLQEVLNAMEANGTDYKASTIRTHVTSRMCADAPAHHGVTYNDFQRVGNGLYRLMTPPDP